MIEINNTTDNKISKKLIKEVVEKFLRKYKKEDLDVSIAFVEDDKIKELNNKYRKKDQVTDILSFEGDEDSLGELIISPNQIKKQAKMLGVKIEEELIFILIHGLFHLIGYTDETEVKKNKMIKLGEDFIINL